MTGWLIGAALGGAALGWFLLMLFTRGDDELGVIGAVIGAVIGGLAVWWASGRIETANRGLIGAVIGGAVLGWFLGYLIAELNWPGEFEWPGRNFDRAELRHRAVRSIGGVTGGLVGWLAWRRSQKARR